MVHFREMINRIRNALKKIVHYLSERHILQCRKSFAKSDLRSKLQNSSPVSKDEYSVIDAFWMKFPKGRRWFDKRWFDVYRTIESDPERLKLYIPDDFWYCFVDAFFTSPKKSTVIDDKNFYDLYFHSENRPRTIVRKIDKMFMDDKYNLITFDEAFRLCAEEGSVIIKPSVNSCGGHGIKFWSSSENSGEELHNALDGGNIIVQEIVRQHHDLSVIHQSSLNTIRIMLLIYDGEVIPLSSVLRMGKDNAKVDNASSGGIVCGINADGSLKNVAYDTKANVYLQHPQGTKFEAVKISQYSQCLEMAKRLAPRFSYVSKLQSWDIAITESGEPLLIEVNLSCGQIDFQQLCNGPIFGNRTEEFLDYVYRNNGMLNGNWFNGV